MAAIHMHVCLYLELMQFFSCSWPVCSPWCPLHSSHNQTTTRLENDKPGLPRHDWYTAISLQLQNSFFSCVGHFVVLTDICLLMKLWKSVSWHILLPVLLGLLVCIYFMFNKLILRTSNIGRYYMYQYFHRWTVNRMHFVAGF